MTDRAPLQEYADNGLEPGFEYPERQVSIGSAGQHRPHGGCDLAAEVFGEIADPSLVRRLSVVMMANRIAACRTGWGQVHTVHPITQRRPIGLGESLTLQGILAGLVLHPRGQVLRSTRRYVDSDGETPFEVTPDALVIDPVFELKRPQLKPKTGIAKHGGEQPYEQLFTESCIPEASVGYCQGSNDPIHSDVESAQYFGFRAPILAGT